MCKNKLILSTVLILDIFAGVSSSKNTFQNILIRKIIITMPQVEGEVDVGDRNPIEIIKVEGSQQICMPVKYFHFLTLRNIPGYCYAYFAEMRNTENNIILIDRDTNSSETPTVLAEIPASKIKDHKEFDLYIGSRRDEAGSERLYFEFTPVSNLACANAIERLQEMLKTHGRFFPKLH